MGSDLFIIVASPETALIAAVEVVNAGAVENSEIFLTKLIRGQYFGQKSFLTRRSNKRGATVRVPIDSPVPVQVARLTPEYFDRPFWDSFRGLLLVRAVPMIQCLPRKERQQVLQAMQVRDFKDGDHIIRQGDPGK